MSDEARDLLEEAANKLKGDKREYVRVCLEPAIREYLASADSAPSDQPDVLPGQCQACGQTGGHESYCKEVSNLEQRLTRSWMGLQEADDELYDLMEPDLGDFDDIGHDWYDNSFEAYGVATEARLSEETLAKLREAGFVHGWLNHVDGWETFYGNGSRQNKGKVKTKPRRRTVSASRKTLIKAFVDDPDFRETYVATIACSLMDEQPHDELSDFGVYSTRMRFAERIMDTLFNPRELEE